jgi:hypothetical protein
MNDLSHYSSFATLIGLPISIMGLLFAYLSLLKEQKKIIKCVSQFTQKIDAIFETLSEIVNLHNKYSSFGAQYHNCSFTNAPLDSEAINEQYSKGENVSG